MKLILSTLNVFLRQEWITVGVYSVATALFMLLIFNTEVSVSQDSIRESITFQLLLIEMLSLFVGVYLGSGFLRLQQSHLWFTQKKYRITIVISLICAACLYGIIQFFALLHIGWSLQVSLLAPACITILNAQFVIVRNKIMKFFLPSTPFFLYQLSNFNVNIDLLLFVLVLITSAALYFNASTKPNKANVALGLFSGNIKQQMMNPISQKLNSIAEWFIEALKLPIKPKALSMILLQPTNRSGIINTAIICSVLIILYLLNDTKLDSSVFAIMMIGSTTLSLYMDIQLLSAQSKPIAHLYSKSKHFQFKQKVISMIGRHIVFQASLIIFTLLLFNLFLSGFVKPVLLLKLGITITAIAVVFAPLMLCLNWFKINIKLILSVLTYVATAVLFCGWLFQHSLNELIGLPIIVGIVLLTLIRTLSMSFWKRQPIEQFMRTYG